MNERIPAAQRKQRKKNGEEEKNPWLHSSGGLFLHSMKIGMSLLGGGAIGPPENKKKNRTVSAIFVEMLHLTVARIELLSR